MKALLLPFLFVASAFFSATETAFFALRRVDFLKWKEEGNRTAARIEGMLESPGRVIASIFIGNEIANVAISSILAGLLVPAFPGQGKLLALAAGTLGILILGDLTPKCLVWPRARAFSLFAAAPFRLFERAVAPVRALVERAADRIVRLMGGRTPGEGEGVSEREIRAIVDVGEEAGTLDAGEKVLIHNIFDLTERRAGEIMTPLPDVFMVPADLPYGELLARFRRFRRSRIPVYDGDPKNVAGVLHFKELLRLAAGGEEAPAWRDFVKPPFVIPASKKLPRLLRDFQRRKIHLALVVDEYGELVGIVTLEDVLEELFGEIREEHDREAVEVAPRPDGTFRVLAGMPVYRFNERFGADLPEAEWDTVAGLLLHEFGRLPGRGDSVAIGRFLFTVERIKGIRIAEVDVRRLPGEGS